jgi:hypothetical protein
MIVLNFNKTKPKHNVKVGEWYILVNNTKKPLSFASTPAASNEIILTVNGNPIKLSVPYETNEKVLIYKAARYYGCDEEYTIFTQKED